MLGQLPGHDATEQAKDQAAHGLAGGLHNYDAVFGAQLSLALFELHEMAEEAEAEGVLS